MLPLVGRRLPIIADEYVEPEFGTGALKITPGHDPNDFEIGARHGLEQVGDRRGRADDRGGRGALRRPDGDKARGRWSPRSRGGPVLRREPYAHNVPHSDRSGVRIEPLISLQWFCDMGELAEPAIAAVKDGPGALPPREARGPGSTSTGWRTSAPWCVSRQLWWGHQLPVWYTRTRRDPRAARGAAEPATAGSRRDEDVLDTWFSSALWPFATLGWPEQTPELRALLPDRRALTARDIIFLWVARMVMMGVEFTGELPVHRRPHPLRHPGPRRPPDVQVARHRHRPDRGDRRARRRRRALRAARDVLDPGRALLAPRDPAGARPGQQALERVAPDAARGAEGVEPAPERAETVEDRWIVSRLERDHRAGRRSCSTPSSFSAAALGCTSYLERAVRLVPRAGQAAAVRRGRRPRGGLGDAAVRARPHAAPAAPDDAPRDRGAVVVPAGRARAAGRGAMAGREPRALRRRGRG